MHDDKFVFDADEFGIVYKLSPDMISAHSLFEGKRQKDRITQLVFCNLVGSEKFETVSIKYTEEPKLFRESKVLSVALVFFIVKRFVLHTIYSLYELFSLISI